MSIMLFSPDTLANGLKVASGQHTTVAASDAVVTGLRRVHLVVAALDSDPVAGCQSASAVAGLTTGTITIKTWKATATADTAVIAASTFSKKVNWVAIGE
jgi:hypothetical protein